MGIKTPRSIMRYTFLTPLKNLPTTWGLRHFRSVKYASVFTLKNLPTTWGLRLEVDVYPRLACHSEKPPHHSGIIQR